MQYIIAEEFYNTSIGTRMQLLNIEISFNNVNQKINYTQ